MRIIAGDARSRKLVTPPGQDTRPTSDRVKETLFNVMAPYLYADSVFLDLFSGSGAIGLEALSRGALRCVFVENSKIALKCINENIKTCRYEDRSKVLPYDALSALRLLEGKENFDLIFMDPPYNKGYEEKVLEMLTDLSLLKEDGLVICESSVSTDYSFASDLGFEIIKVKEYKNNKHVFMRKKE
ncbi:MAG: 16S rRNA (guanine(966)-N(2))-methyltransferase RsmD [Lachnospiraceae bacterium]|nr:16S rRNA (guanine(966)-N(2))-methyltransferase RsmD [Lachnospiraceae bacterium]